MPVTGGAQFGAGSGQARVAIAGPDSALAQALTAELESAGIEVTATDADAARPCAAARDRS